MLLDSQPAHAEKEKHQKKTQPAAKVDSPPSNTSKEGGLGDLRRLYQQWGAGATGALCWLKHFQLDPLPTGRGGESPKEDPSSTQNRFPTSVLMFRRGFESSQKGAAAGTGSSGARKTGSSGPPSQLQLFPGDHAEAGAGGRKKTPSNPPLRQAFLPVANNS